MEDLVYHIGTPICGGRPNRSTLDWTAEVRIGLRKRTHWLRIDQLK
jgi:hypothetical protein